MIEKLNTFLFDDKHEDIYKVKQKINEIIEVVNKLCLPIQNYPVGVIGQVQCICNQRGTVCCPLHPNVMH